MRLFYDLTHLYIIKQNANKSQWGIVRHFAYKAEIRPLFITYSKQNMMRNIRINKYLNWIHSYLTPPVVNRHFWVCWQKIAQFFQNSQHRQKLLTSL